MTKIDKYRKDGQPEGTMSETPRSDVDAAMLAIDLTNCERDLAAVTRERDALKHELSQMENEKERLCQTIDSQRAEVERLTRERDALRERIADYENSYRATLDSPCEDEQHCSCVPVLRAELERLTQERDALLRNAEILTDGLYDARAEVERLRALLQVSRPPWNTTQMSWEKTISAALGEE